MFFVLINDSFFTIILSISLLTSVRWYYCISPFYKILFKINNIIIHRVYFCYNYILLVVSLSVLPCHPNGYYNLGKKILCINYILTGVNLYYLYTNPHNIWIVTKIINFVTKYLTYLIFSVLFFLRSCDFAKKKVLRFRLIGICN